MHPLEKGMVRQYIIRRADSGKLNRHTRGVMKSVGVA
jgi:hypothetical protein